MTTQPAPINEFFPIFLPGKTVALVPTKTLSEISTAPPKLTPGPK